MSSANGATRRDPFHRSTEYEATAKKVHIRAREVFSRPRPNCRLLAALQVKLSSVTVLNAYVAKRATWRALSFRAFFTIFPTFPLPDFFALSCRVKQYKAGGVGS